MRLAWEIQGSSIDHILYASFDPKYFLKPNDRSASSFTYAMRTRSDLLDNFGNWRLARIAGSRRARRRRRTSARTSRASRRGRRGQDRRSPTSQRLPPPHGKSTREIRRRPARCKINIFLQKSVSIQPTFRQICQNVCQNNCK